MVRGCCELFFVFGGLSAGHEIDVLYIYFRTTALSSIILFEGVPWTKIQ
jgi:hypothetical protein